MRAKKSALGEEQQVARAEQRERQRQGVGPADGGLGKGPQPNAVSLWRPEERRRVPGRQVDDADGVPIGNVEDIARRIERKRGGREESSGSRRAVGESALVRGACDRRHAPGRAVDRFDDHAVGEVDLVPLRIDRDAVRVRRTAQRGDDVRCRIELPDHPCVGEVDHAVVAVSELLGSAETARDLWPVDGAGLQRMATVSSAPVVVSTARIVV